MCIVIHKPANAHLSLSTVLRGYQQNDDGWGLVARGPEGLIIRRDFGIDADGSLLDTYDELRSLEVTLHCRIGTSGEKSIVNTHPFEVSDGVWMFHNGVIAIDRSSDLRRCDSYHVANALRNALAGEDISLALRDPDYAKSLATYAGKSKLVFVDALGVTIINEHLGYWSDGCWFSNESARLGYEPAFSVPSPRDRESELDDDALDREVTYPYYDDAAYFDEAALRAEALAFLDDCSLSRIDEIVERCYSDPELVAEAFSVLLQEQQLKLGSLTT